MQVGMESEFLAPGVKDGGEAGFRPETVPPLGEFDEGLGGGLEQQIIEALSILQDQGVDFVGQCDDDVEVGGRQELLGTLEKPADLLKALTLGAVTVAA
jgi:hypothetical protein